MMMKMMTGTAVAAAMALGATAQAAEPGDNVVIAGWNFNDPVVEAATTAITASTGTGTMSLVGFNGGQTNFTGTTVNALAGDAAGRDMALQNGTGAGAPTSGDGGFVDFSFSTIDLEDIILTFARQRSGTGFSTNTWSFSNDGGLTFTTAATETIGVAGTATTYAGEGVQTIDFSSFSGIEDQVSVIVRLTLSNPTSATAASGNNRFDNINFSGTVIPEPASLALLGLGSLLIAGRRRQRA
jgi:hypothetical protein